MPFLFCENPNQDQSKSGRRMVLYKVELEKGEDKNLKNPQITKSEKTPDWTLSQMQSPSSSWNHRRTQTLRREDATAMILTSSQELTSPSYGKPQPEGEKGKKKVVFPLVQTEPKPKKGKKNTSSLAIYARKSSSKHGSFEKGKKKSQEFSRKWDPIPRHSIKSMSIVHHINTHWYNLSPLNRKCLFVTHFQNWGPN